MDIPFRNHARRTWHTNRITTLLCILALTSLVILAYSYRIRRNLDTDPKIAHRARVQLNDIGKTRRADREAALTLAKGDATSLRFVQVWFSSFLPASEALALVPQEAEVLALYNGYGDVRGYFPLEQGEYPTTGVSRLSDSLRTMPEDAEVQYYRANGQPALWGLLLRGSGNTISELAGQPSVYWLRVLRNRVHETPLYTPYDIARMRALCQCNDDTAKDAQ